MPSGRQALGRVERQTRRRLAANLKSARARLGLSQERTAERADFSLQYYQRIERGIPNTPIDTLTRLARALDVDVAELLRKP